MTPPPTLTPFEARWLAETVRRHEERCAPLDDAAVLAGVAAAPAEAGGDFEARILRRAEALGAREGWRAALLEWRRRARLALFAALALAPALGFGIAAGVLGDGSRPVNVVWALGGLLGVHLFSLLLWLLGTLLQPGGDGGGALRRGGLLGRAWLRLVAALDRSPAAAELGLALAGLLGRGRLAAWGVGAVGHALWALALAGAALGVLLLLATRRYGFVWETTILPAQTFIDLSAALGALPAALGFPVPDAATVAASGDAPMLAEAGRRAWAGWLLGALLVYGVLPRVALAVLCAGLWGRATRRLRLDLARPGYARLRARLLPDSERLGVRDPAPATLPHAPRHAAHAAAAEVASEVASEVAALAALELGDDLGWPPPDLEARPGATPANARPPAGPTPTAEEGEGPGASLAAFDAGRLDSREQRRAALERFAALPPRRLLVAIDARRTPDRGSLGLIGELAEHAVYTRVWALVPPGGGSSARLGLWREGLAALGFDADALIVDPAAARAWLAGGAVEGGR